jgi:hypothetical protein
MHETGGARKPRKKAVPKGQCKDPPESLNYLNAQAQLLRKDQEMLGNDSAAALEHHQATVDNPPTHLNTWGQLQRKDQESLSKGPPQAGMPTLIPLAQVNLTSASDQRYPIPPNRLALNTPPKKILARLQEEDVTDISPYDHKTPPPPLQLSVDMISYAKKAIEGHTSKYNGQEHLTENNGDDNNDESSEVDDDNRDGDYKQRDSSDDDDDLSLAAHKLVFPTSLFEYSDDDFDHLLDNKELDEDAKRIEYAYSRKRDTIGHRKGALLKGDPQEPSYERMMDGKERVAR